MYTAPVYVVSVAVELEALLVLLIEILVVLELALDPIVLELTFKGGPWYATK
jgi:hypothetical protein